MQDGAGSMLTSQSSMIGDSETEEEKADPCMDVYGRRSDAKA